MAKRKDSVSASLAIPAGAEFTATGLTLTGELSATDWQALGGQLFAIDRGLQWAIGDWINYGESRYGETYTAAMEATGKDRYVLANLAWVARKVERSRRRDTLSWSHHAEVAALDPAEQERILDRAEAEGWSQRAVRSAVQELRHELAPGTSKALAAPQVDVPELNRKIASQVARVRAIAGVGQRTAAQEVLGSPTQQGTWSRIENAKQRPNLATLEKIAEWSGSPMSAFGVNEGATLPAALVQRAASEALDALESGSSEGRRRAIRILERLATALVEADL